MSDDTMVLAEMIDRQCDAEVEHILPIRAYTAPQSISLN
jgi:hypothetical protein